MPRQDLVDTLVAQIARGTYFTIFAPRQIGKTTLLRALDERLQRWDNSLTLTLSFEAYEEWNTLEFLQGFTFALTEQLITQLKEKQLEHVNDIEQFITAERPIDSFFKLQQFFLRLHRLLPEIQLILLIDEFDGTPQAAISPLLQMWRQIYLNSPPPRPIHSIALIGLQNIAKLNLGRSSPFNIARQMRLQNFTLIQVQELLAQYTAETGQAFATGVVEELYELTAGHPFLVNRLAAIITEEIATDRTLPVLPVDLDRAQRKLVRETNYNFETLGHHAHEHPDEILAILFGRVLPFNLNNELISTLYTQGIISESATETCQIANPIYRQVLIAYLRPLGYGLQGELLVNGFDFRALATPDSLDIKTILSNFRQFVERRGKEAFKVSPMLQEATGQYMLMAYLDAALRQVGGAVYTEVPSGDGRLELIVVYGKHRYVIETKMWRGAAYFDRGLDQLENYLASEGTQEGYYVVFHTRPNVYGQLTQDEFEYTKSLARADIHIYLVRLGQIFEEIT